MLHINASPPSANRVRESSAGKAQSLPRNNHLPGMTEEDEEGEEEIEEVESFSPIGPGDTEVRLDESGSPIGPGDTEVRLDESGLELVVPKGGSGGGG